MDTRLIQTHGVLLLFKVNSKQCASEKYVFREETKISFWPCSIWTALSSAPEGKSTVWERRCSSGGRPRSGISCPGGCASGR